MATANGDRQAVIYDFKIPGFTVNGLQRRASAWTKEFSKLPSRPPGQTVIADDE
jgi:hypothetical protein